MNKRYVYIINTDNIRHEQTKQQSKQILETPSTIAQVDMSKIHVHA